MTRKLRISTAIKAASLTAALLATALLSASDAGAATFSPSLEVTLSNTSPGANPDLIARLVIPRGDANFADLVAFTPPQIAIPDGANIPLGAVAGTLSTGATLGVLNAACSAPLQFSFSFFNASTDNSPANLITPPPVVQPNGTITADRLQLLAADANANFIRDGIEKYPSFLNDLFGGLTPRARFIGFSSPPFLPAFGLTPILQLVLFEPGTQFDPDTPVDPRLGYPSVTVLLDPTAPATRSPITDFCTPLIPTTTTFGVSQDNPFIPGDQGGLALRTNPAGDATLNFVLFATSQRDADDDGFENALDTCPFVPNLEDPRSSVGHPDFDGIDGACDPDPNAPCWPGAPGTQPGGQLFDCDGDGWLNAGDNCPMLVNRDQADADRDDIGDVCDPNPDSPDGHNHSVCVVATVNVGAGGTPVVDPLTVPPCAAAPLVLPVVLDIKPGAEPNSINLGSNGVIPVAILTTPDFAASTVDPTSTVFEGASPLHHGLDDVDGDGDLDLIIQFRVAETAIDGTATEACLSGETSDGQPIEGCDSIRIVPRR